MYKNNIIIIDTKQTLLTENIDKNNNNKNNNIKKSNSYFNKIIGANDNTKINK